MAWFILVIAGLFEIVWAVGLKYTEGFTRLWPSIITAAGMVISLYLLSMALKQLPIGTAYAVWTALIGIFFLGESRDIARILSILLIVAGIVGLKIFSPAQ